MKNYAKMTTSINFDVQANLLADVNKSERWQKPFKRRGGGEKVSMLFKFIDLVSSINIHDF